MDNLKALIFIFIPFCFQQIIAIYILRKLLWWNHELQQKKLLFFVDEDDVTKIDVLVHTGSNCSFIILMPDL